MKKLFGFIFIFSFMFVVFSVNIIKVEAANTEKISVSYTADNFPILTVSGLKQGIEYHVDIGQMEGGILTSHYSKAIYPVDFGSTGSILPWVVDDYPVGFLPGSDYTVVIDRITQPATFSVASAIINIPIPTPTITSISPLVGKVGDTITINGNNFIGIDKVLFGSVDVGLNFKAVSSTQITAVVPDGAVNGSITVVTQNFGNIVSSDIFKVNLPTSNLQLSARNITQNSVILSAYGIINQNSYDFYIYDSATYYNKKPLLASDAIVHKVLDLQNPTNPIEITMDGLSPGLKYVGDIDYNSNANPETTYPFVEFSTLQDLTAGLESLATSSITGTSVNIVATGLLATNTYSVILVNDNTTPTPVYSQTINLTPVNGTATVSFSGLTANNTYNAGLIINNNTNSVSARVSFVASDNANTNSNTNNTNVNGTPNSTPFGGLVPPCGQVITKTDPATGKDTSTMPTICDFGFFMQLINNIIKFLLFVIATPLVALIIMYTGYLYITAGGNASQTEKAKHIMLNVVIGFVIALAAWLIINTIITSFNLDSTINTFLAK